MEIELEKTYLLKNLPEGLNFLKSTEIIDIYIPTSEGHPVLRIRKKGDRLEITKKRPIKGNDSSEQSEETIILSDEEFKELSQLKGKRFRKIRHYYNFENCKSMELDVYKDELEGLAVVDFEFNTTEEKDKFQMPNFCLVDVTQEKNFAGGILAGKKYSDVETFLLKYGYKKLKLP